MPTIPGSPASGTIVALLAFGVYAVTLSARPSWDSLRYAALIAFDAPAGLTGGHHVLGGIVADRVYHVARWFGTDIEPLRALQLTSAFGGAAAVGGLYALLRAATAGTLMALSASVGLGASLAFWDVATDGEVYGVAAALLVFAWAALFRIPPTDKGRSGGMCWRATLAGAVTALAVLAHQLNLVMLLSSPLWFKLTRRPARAFLAYLTSAATVATGGYLLAWWASGWARTWYGLYSWLTHYVRVGLHFPPSDALRGAIHGLLASVVPMPPRIGSAAGSGWDPVFVADVVVLTAVAGVCIMSWPSTRSEERRSGTGVSAFATIAAVALAAWWEPNSRKFWVPALVCGWLTIGLALARLAGARVVGLALAVGALSSLNLGAMILPRADPNSNPFPAIARQIAAVTAAEDLIVVGSNLLSPSLAYYGRRPHVTNVFALGLDAKYRGRNLRQQLRQAVDEARRRGGRAFISSDALELPADRRAKVPDLPGTIEDLIAPGWLRPALTYSVNGIERTLFELIVNERRSVTGTPRMGREVREKNPQRSPMTQMRPAWSGEPAQIAVWCPIAASCSFVPTLAACVGGPQLLVGSSDADRHAEAGVAGLRHARAR